MTECIILFNDPLPNRISCGFFREKFINCTDEGTAIQHTFYNSPSHRYPYHKSKQHNFFDGWAPLLTGGKADFGNRAPQINFCFGLKKLSVIIILSAEETLRQ